MPKPTLHKLILTFEDLPLQEAVYKLFADPDFIRSEALLIGERYVKKLCTGFVSGGDFWGLDTVDERDSLDDIGEDVGAVESSPLLGGGLHQFVDHREAGGA